MLLAWPRCWCRSMIGAAVKWWPHTPMGKLILIKRPESEDEVLPDTEEYHRG